MGSHSRRESMASASDATPSTSDAPHDPDPDFPFPSLDAPLDRRHLRLAAYDLFFAACRSGAASRRTQDNTVLTSTHSPALPAGAPKPLFAPSRIKTALGLKTRGRPAQLRKAPSSSGSTTSSAAVRHKRPRTSAELMRQQMSVPAKNDGRLRLAFTRILLEQRGRRGETIIFPLELLRHLKPSDFADGDEYHLWQKRQLKILEAGLLLHPAVPLDKAAGPSAARLREIVRAGELRPIDAGKNSDVMRSLSNCVAALAWRAPGGATAEVCHWADGFPLNLHLYLVLLQSIFDKKDDSKVLEEVDELVELIKKTWPTLGIDKDVHNLCFAWVLFQQFVRTGQAEEELLSASLTMLAEVGDDAKRADKDPVYAGILSSTLTSMQSWAEKKLLDYHECFPKNVIGTIENVLPLALSAVKILDDGALTGDVAPADSTRNRVDYYIRSSLRNAFAKVLEAQGGTEEEEEEEKKGEDFISNSLLQLVKETEELAVREKEKFSPILKRWHPIAEGVAAITLHDCYGVLLKQYLNNVTVLSNEVVCVLQAAGKLEKVLIQMVEESSDDADNDLMKEMIPYEVDSIILDLTKSWTKDRFSKVRDCISRAKENETWNPTSKTEPYAQSVVELMKLAKETVDEFLKIPAAVLEETVQELANRLESLLQDYIAFVASCGSKGSYIPALPPLTRCNKDSKITKLWKKASPYCKDQGGAGDGHNPRPSTSRGTQRLYIRLNTLHYLQAHLQYLSKSLSLAPTPPKTPQVVGGLGAGRRRFSNPPPSYFDAARAAIQAASHDVSEVAAYRLIFLDSNCVFYDGLYSGEVVNSRIRPALRTMKQNLTLLAAILTDTAQPLAIKELAKASFEAFLMVLLAGGPSRSFLRSDSEILSEDFAGLKRMLCTFGEGMVTESAVSSEVKMVEGIIDLMGQSTEQLVEELSELAREAASLAVDGGDQALLVPPTTGRWNRSDPNTIFRVLCHRKDDAANRFLKTTFNLTKRR